MTPTPRAEMMVGKAREILEAMRQKIDEVLGVVKIIAATDMFTTLPGQIGTMLANAGNDAVRLFPCRVPMPRVVVKQFWHSRFDAPLGSNGGAPFMPTRHGSHDATIKRKHTEYHETLIE